ncbi:MAG TPA: protoporphyrinogen oxidase [Rectinemataceae bacterium]|nr:protoporphyrinogen oxidase [Rectinemataceae bacterium]
MGAKRVIVIGGGIAGLSAAYRIKKLVPGVELRLVETERRLGGKVLTDRVDDFVVEGGPDTFVSYKPAGIGLCRELGIEDRLHGTNKSVRGSFVMRKGRLYEMPEGLTGLIPSKFGPMATTGLISPFGKLRMGLDLFVPAKRDGLDESLAEFVRRRLGNELYERLIEPLMSGIYAGDGEELSLGATFPQLRQSELEHGSLVVGMFATKKKNREAARKAAEAARTAEAAGTPLPARKQWPAFVTPETGLAEIVEALVATFEAKELLLGTKARRVERVGKEWVVEIEGGEVLRCEALVLATPSHGAAPLIRGIDPAMADALAAIPHASTATLTVAYRESDLPKPLNAYGYVIPKREGRAVLATTWTSTKFPHRAPPGYALIRSFIGRAGNDAGIELSDEELLRMVKEEQRDVLGITAEPIFHRLFRWPLAMPQYTKGHLDRLAAIEGRSAEWPGLALAGNAYRGIGLPDCIASGEGAAKSVAAYLAN